MNLIADPIPSIPGRSGRRFELGLSENPFAPLPSVVCALHDAMKRVNRYPEFLPDTLPRLIADRLRLPPERIIAGPGATGVALQTLLALLRPGQSMVFASPTFDGYPILCEMTGVVPVTVPLNAAGGQDLPAMAAAVDDRTGAVVVCRPHNPTGTLVGAEELTWFLAALPGHLAVLLDEAYVEFVAERDILDVARVVSRHPNVLVLRTFSKAFGLAGLRIGYAFGAAEMIGRIRRWQLPFGMNSAAPVAVAASYAAEAELAERVRSITIARDSLRNTLLHSGIPVPESSANFLLLHGGDIAAALDRAGISAKAYPDGSARIAVGEPEANLAVLDALRARNRITG